MLCYAFAYWIILHSRRGKLVEEVLMLFKEPWLSICGLAHRGPVLWFSCVLASDRNRALCFVSSQCCIFFIWVSLSCLIDRVEDPLCGSNMYLQFGNASELRASFAQVKLVFALRPQVVFLLTVQGRFLYHSPLFVRLWFHMWRVSVYFRSSSLLVLVPQKGCAPWFWHFLGIFSYTHPLSLVDFQPICTRETTVLWFLICKRKAHCCL